MLKTITIYAKIYDDELNSAWIPRATELSPSSSCPLPAVNYPLSTGTRLEGGNSAARKIHAE